MQDGFLLCRMMLAEAGGAAYLREFQQRFSSEEKFFAKEPREWKVARCDKYGQEGGRKEGGGGERRSRGSICRFSQASFTTFPLSAPLVAEWSNSSCKTVVPPCDKYSNQTSYGTEYKLIC